MKSIFEKQKVADMPRIFLKMAGRYATLFWKILKKIRQALSVFIRRAKKAAILVIKRSSRFKKMGFEIPVIPRFLLFGWKEKALFAFAAFAAMAFFSPAVFAVWNGTFYNPGETLNPECSPTDIDCDVLPPLTATSISDAAYGAGWNADTSHAPSKNAVYDQIQVLVASNHAPLTLGTANGLSLSAQELSLALASLGTTGALSSTDWATFNSKQDALVSGTSIKTINSASLLGSGDILLQTPLVADTDYLTPATAAGTYEPVRGADDNYVTDPQLVIIGNTSGVNTGDQTNITGNAGTATALETPRTIAGVSFDGTANISLASTNLSDSSNIARLSAGNAFIGANTFSSAGGVGTIQSAATGPAGYALVLNAPSNANHLAFQADGIQKYIQYVSGNDLRFFDSTGNANQLVLESGGNVGIGTTNPAYTLDVLGTGNFSGTVAAGTFSGPLTGNVTGNVTGNADTATKLATTRAIYGNTFDGSADLTAIISSAYGGTGSGFTKFTGPATTEKIFTLPNSNATLARTDAGQTFAGTQAFSSAINATTAGINVGGGSLSSYEVPSEGVFTPALIADNSNLIFASTAGTKRLVFTNSEIHAGNSSGTLTLKGWSPRSTGLTVLGIAAPANTAGNDIIIAGGQGTGTGIGGSIYLKTAPAGSSGSSENALVTRILVDHNGNVGIGTTTLDAGLKVAINGASSAPSGLFSGTWFTGGTSTTTKPQFLIEPSGATSTAWSTSGTGFGINAASGFAGNLIDAQVNGTSKFSVTSGGAVTATAEGTFSRVIGNNGTSLLSGVTIGGTFRISTDNGAQIYGSSGQMYLQNPTSNFGNSAAVNILGGDNGGVSSSHVHGGSVYIKGGAAANNFDGTTPGNGGSVYIIGGAKKFGGSDGNVILGTDGTNTRGYVGVGDTAPSARLTVKATAGDGVSNVFQVLNSSGAVKFAIAPGNADAIVIGATVSMGAQQLSWGGWQGISGTGSTGGSIIFSTETASTERMRLTSVGNLKIGGTAARGTTEGTNQLVLFNGTAPVGTLANGASLYSESGELRVMDAAGNSTLLSPHEDVNNYWVFSSENKVLGTSLTIDTELLLKKINQEFGWDFVHETKDGRPIDQHVGSLVSLQGLNLSLESIALPIEEGLERSFSERFFGKIAEWFADTGNGIGDFFANRVRTQELCVEDGEGETCITRSQLDALLLGGSSGNPSSEGDSDSSTGNNGASSAPTGTPETEATDAAENTGATTIVTDTNTTDVMPESDTASQPDPSGTDAGTTSADTDTTESAETTPADTGTEPALAE